MKRLVLIFAVMLLVCSGVFAQNKPIKIQINYVDYEVLPYDLDGTYDWYEAKNACYRLTAFGNSDWFLPDKTELDGLYYRKEEIGKFRGDRYWSSSEWTSDHAWWQRFSDGYQGYYDGNKGYSLRVRCVRKY